MSDISSQLWLKQYLMRNEDTMFYEIRKSKSYSLFNRKNVNISGHHLSNGEFDSINELKAIYEYIERWACAQVPEGVVRQRSIFENNTLLFDELGFAWTGQKFEPLVEKPRFVEGISLRNGEKYWLPSVFVYYLDNHLDEWNAFAGNSNGNALGDSLMSALDRAILEFVERDKFIKYWYLGEGALVKISEDFLDKKVKQKRIYFKSRGYEVDFFDIRNEPKGIHTVWCLFKSLDSKNPLFLWTALAADINLMRAVDKAFEEASAMYFSRALKRGVNSEDKQNTFRLKQSILEENLRYYFSYERETEINKLLQTAEKMKMFSGEEEKKHSIKELALEAYQDIIYIPVQCPVLTQIGLYEVKAVGLGGNNIYFAPYEKLAKKGRIDGPCPFA